MRGKLPIQHIRWVGGGMQKKKVGRELRRGEGSMGVEEKTIVRGSLKV